MKCMRILPETCAKTVWPFSSSTLNIAFGSVSVTVPSTSIASSFTIMLVSLLQINHSFVDRKSTRLNSSHVAISYAVFCLKKQTTNTHAHLHHQRAQSR